MRKNTPAIIGVMLAIALAGCGGRSKAEQGATTTPSASQPEEQKTLITLPPAVQKSEKEFTVTGQNFSFAPSTMTVKKGDTVKITFKNAEGFHDFRIDEFNAATQRINGGEEDTITLTADKSGYFEYYCSVGSHRAMGMRGTLTVE